MAKTTQATEEKTEAGAQQDQQNDTAQADSKTQAQSVEFSEAAAGGDAAASGSIDILLDMDVPVMVVIGQTQISIRRLLQLGPGSVLELDKPIDAPVELYLRDTKFATGDIVVVDGRFAVRIKQILGVGDAASNAAQT